MKRPFHNSRALRCTVAQRVVMVVMVVDVVPGERGLEAGTLVAVTRSRFVTHPLRTKASVCHAATAPLLQSPRESRSDHLTLSPPYPSHLSPICPFAQPPNENSPSLER